MNLLQTESPRKTARIVAIILISVLMLSSSFVVFVAPVLAHGDTYCGHSTRWDWPYKQVFLRHYDNGDHRWKSTKWFYNGTGYHMVDGSTDYHRTDCG